MYILLLILFIIISVFIYIKLSFPFWNTQPVYHSYDFWRFFYTKPFRIHKEFSYLAKSKFCDLKDVEIVPFVDASDAHKKAFVNLLQCYFLQSDNEIYFFNLDNLEHYLGGHMYGSYISFYKQIDQYIGCISSRSGELLISGSREPIYYIDHFVMKRDADHRGISRRLFETHIYKTNFISKMELLLEPVMVWLFRRDRELLKGIVPLVEFTTGFYALPNNAAFYKQNRLPEHVLLLDIHSGNLDLITDFIGYYREKFSIFAMTDNFIELIKRGQIFVYVLKRLDVILGVYIFRDTRIRNEDDGIIVELAGRISNTSADLFYIGFLHALSEISKKLFRILKMDSIGDRINMVEFYKLNETKGAYYLYNYVVPVSNESNIFILF